MDDFTYAEKLFKAIMTCYMILRFLIFIALIVIAIEMNEMVDILGHELYHTYNCCKYQ